MKDIFDTQTILELQERVERIDSQSKAQWGKMDIYQMLKHCTENEKMLLREKSFRRLFMGRLFGKMALNSNLKDDAPLGKNSPTHPDIKISGTGNVEEEKQLWIELLRKYADQKPMHYTRFIHPFFGQMDHSQVGRYAYKHIDHHLRQFGV